MVIDGEVIVEIDDDGGYQALSVEIESLTDFIAFMEQDVDPGINRGLGEARSDATTGEQLCAGLTGPMLAGSNANYEYAQRYPVENMVRYLFTASAMIEAIEQLTRLYRSTEEMASVPPEQVQGMLTAAFEQKKADYEAWQASNPPRDAYGNRMDL